MAACRPGGGNDADLSRYLQADALPSDPSTRVTFGRGHLPKDFPAGLPVPDHSTLLGWQRTTTDTAISWEIVYEVSSDPSRVTDLAIQQLKGGYWQITDRATQHGFESLNLDGQGANAGRTGIVAIGASATNGKVVLIEEAGQDK